MIQFASKIKQILSFNEASPDKDPLISITRDYGWTDGWSVGRVLRGYTRLLCAALLSDLIAMIIEIMVSFLSSESVCNVRGWVVERGLVLRVEDLNSMWDKLKRFCGDSEGQINKLFVLIRTLLISQLI